MNNGQKLWLRNVHSRFNLMIDNWIHDIAITASVILFYPLLCFQSCLVFTLTQRKTDIFACCLGTITVIRWPKRNCKRRKGRKRDRKCWQRMKSPEKWVSCENLNIYLCLYQNVCSYGRDILNVNFSLESTKNRAEFLLGPAEKTPRPVTVSFLLQVEFIFFMN